ncbi:PLP-dependent aminotransferase family protein [Naumannella halotolerans]|uniref:2-aminoadipate transaminase n=1 Tax=Naumannella halotolerans TaxID=993414 RepID=A0A4R7J7Y4_9ACTN|nr:PLP-dependent aminotransferase family protein [Naumannella halotolerans]TDT32617.1 2-aminoadipate transaminase [Naumannella halotolerans]
MSSGHPSGPLPLADRADQLVGSVIDSSTSLLAAQTHDIVRFAMGAPAPEAIPDSEFTAIADRVWDPDSFTYGATEGEPELIEAVAERLDVPCDPERIVITSGGMQGLDLAGKLFIDPGDLVVIESPTYTNGSATALSYGADLLEVGMDDDGMDVDQLEELVARAGRTPKAIYTIPNFQNPKGVTLSRERRERVIELARRWNSVIIDDDPYGMLRFRGDPIPGFPELSDNDPLVFSVRTFSKILAPGLRVGWVDADPRLRQLLINAKQAMDTCTNVPAQQLVAGYIATGGLADHLDHLRGLYAEREAAMQTSLQTHLGELVSSTHPDGGFFCWLTLNGADGVFPPQELFELALAEGVAYIPGVAFSPAGAFSDALRLCFASSTPERIDEGVRRLAVALDRARAELTPAS